MRGDIVPGAVFPDYELTDHTKTRRRLSGLQGVDPMVVLQTREFRASVGAQWTFLSDPGRTVQTDLEIREYTDPFHDPMIPHTLVLAPGVHPDWDLAAPGLRQAWDAGDHSMHYPYQAAPVHSTA